jgi:hypothetical protein
MFEKEIILKEQVAAPCLFQCSPDRKSWVGRSFYATFMQEIDNLYSR